LIFGLPDLQDADIRKRRQKFWSHADSRPQHALAAFRAAHKLRKIHLSAGRQKAPGRSPRGGLGGVVDSLLFAQHAIEMFRRSLLDGAPKHRLDQLANRLAKILAETRKLNPAG
jgi:hypothetical protein